MEVIGYNNGNLASISLKPGLAHYQVDFMANISITLKVRLVSGSGTRTVYVDNVKLEELKGEWDAYRFAFNGKEMDNEAYGEGNLYDYGFRVYNPRLGKFLSVDPLIKEYPWLTPYQFASNLPINSIDLDGLESQVTINGKVVYGPQNMAVVNDKVQSNPSESQNLAMGKPQPLKLPNILLTSYAASVGVTGMQAANVRTNYTQRVSQLEPLKATDPMTGSNLRNQYVEQARVQTPQPFREMAKDMKPQLKPNPNGRFWVTNAEVNGVMKAVGAASKGVVVFGVANSTYNIITSQDRVETATQEAMTWTAAYLGGQAGGEAGAIFGPWGAIAGAVGGSVVAAISVSSETPNVTPAVIPAIPQDNTQVVKP